MKRSILLLALFWCLPLFAQQQIPITGGVVTADLSSGLTSFKVNLNQNVSSVVLTGQHPGSGGNTVICTLFFVQDGTGGWTVTFGGNITGAFAVNATPLFTTVEQFAFDFTSNTWYAVNAGSAGSSGISGSGTANTISMFTGPFTIGNGPINVANGVTSSSNPFSQPASLFNCVNSASGTTNGLLVTRDASGNCINLPAAQTTKIVGVVYTGGGTSGVSLICKIGTCPVTLDNTSVIDDCIIAASSGSQGHDAGPTCPTGVQQLGIAQSVNAGTGTAANVDVFISDIQSGPSGPVQTLQVNGVTLAGTLDNFNATTPAAQANNQNLVFQTDNATPTSNVSVEVPLATTGQLGLIELARDLCGTDVAPIVCGIQQIPVTFTSPAANDVICFPTSSTLANCKQGVPIRTVSGNSDAILSTDRVSDVRYTASSGATAVTLTRAGTGAFTNNFTMVVTNAQGSGAVTITPATSTINGAATLVIPAGNYCFIYSDNSNYFANCGITNGGTSTFPRLDQVLDPTAQKTFNVATFNPVAFMSSGNFAASSWQQYLAASVTGGSSCTFGDPLQISHGLDALSACVNTTSSTTTGLNNGVGSYVFNNDGQFSGHASNAFFGYSICVVGGEECEGISTVTADTSGQTNSLVVGTESGLRIYNASTTGYGFYTSIQNGTSQPTTLVGYNIGAPLAGATIGYTAGFNCAATSVHVLTNTSGVCVKLGTNTTGASQASYEIQFNPTNASSAVVPVDLLGSVDADGVGLLTSQTVVISQFLAQIGTYTYSNLVSHVACDATHTSVIAWISDGPASPVWGATVSAGGGSNKIGLACNGTNWIIFAAPKPTVSRALVFSYGDPGNSSAITAGSTATDYMTVPFACTISAYNILVDAGTVTIKFWKVATGTAIPTSGNSISTSGVSISSGTAIHSTTVTDFTTTAVSANDIIAMNVSTVATAKFVSATLECDQ